MKESDVVRDRILCGVQQWARKRQVRLFPKKTFELAALVAESEAEGIYDATAMRREQFEEKIERLRKLGEDFRSEAEQVPKAEREL